MKRKSILMFLSVFLIGFTSCNEDAATQLPTFIETIEFGNTSLSILENVDTANIPIILSSFTKFDVSVELEVYLKSRDTTAVEGVNFSIPNKTVIVKAGESSASLPVIINNDTIVNSNRSFYLRIIKIDGADPARISQGLRVVIENEDFWPEVQFDKSKIKVDERKAGVWVPYEVTGIIYAPMTATIKLTGGTAGEGTNFEWADQSFTFTEATRDSVYIPINPVQEEMYESLTFDLEWNIEGGGITAKNKKTTVEITDVKVVNFAFSQALISEKDAEGFRKVFVPMKFSYVLPSGISAKVAVKSGLNTADYIWEENDLFTNKDTTINAILKINPDVDVSNGIEFELVDDGTADVVDGVLKANLGSSVEKDDWEILFFTTEEPTGEGANDGKAIHLIDGKEDTFWHSKWSGGSDPLPYIIEIDLGSRVSVSAIELKSRIGHTATKVATIEFSDDREEWSLATTFDFKSSDAGAKLEAMPAGYITTGRYLRLTVTEASGTNASLAELYIIGTEL